MSFNLADMLADVPDLGTNRDEITYLPMADIDDDPRNFYQLTGLEDLAANIELCGLQQPIRVREASSRYVIVSGHRRRAACRELGWEEMPCIIDRQTGSPALQELRLIYANSSTRVLSGAELATQAQRVTELLYQLKEEGMEFPGRMRDHVAEAVGISKSKLSRLNVIRTQLHPCLRPLWEADKLTEAVAYELAKLTLGRQKAIFLAQTDDRTKPFKVYADQIQNIAKEMDRLEALAEKTTCTEIYTSKCDHVHVRLEQAAKLGQYSGMSCRGCCCTCFNLEKCKYSCEHAAKDKQALKDKSRQASREQREAREKEELPKRQMIAESYRRVGELRAAAGVSEKDFLIASNSYVPYGAEDRLKELESGSKCALTDRLPGMIWPEDAQRLAAAADILGCSIDYLLCHDTQQPKLEGGWYTGKPTAPGWYITRIVYAETGTVTYPRTWWGGKKWADLKEFETVTHWIPEVEE